MLKVIHYIDRYMVIRYIYHMIIKLICIYPQGDIAQNNAGHETVILPAPSLHAALLAIHAMNIASLAASQACCQRMYIQEHQVTAHTRQQHFGGVAWSPIDFAMPLAWATKEYA